MRRGRRRGCDYANKVTLSIFRYQYLAVEWYCNEVAFTIGARASFALVERLSPLVNDFHSFSEFNIKFCNTIQLRDTDSGILIA